MERIDIESFVSKLDGFSTQQVSFISSLIKQIEVDTIKNCLSSIVSCSDVNETSGDTDVIWFDANEVVSSVIIPELHTEFASVIEKMSLSKEILRG